MDQLGTDFHSTGSVMTPAQLKEYRLKRGECVTCGRRCFQKKLFKMTPITEHGLVLKGRCLNCNPLNTNDASKQADGGVMPALSRRATPQDLMRFSRSQSNLALPNGNGVVNSGPGVLGRSAQSQRSLQSTSLQSVQSNNSGPSTGGPPPQTSFGAPRNISIPIRRASSSRVISNSSADSFQPYGSRGLSARSNASSSSAENGSRAESSRQSEYMGNNSNIPVNSISSNSTGSGRANNGIPQRLSLVRPQQLPLHGGSVRSLSRDSLVSNDESVASNPRSVLASAYIIEEESSGPQDLADHADYQLEGHMSNSTMTDYRSDHRSHLLENSPNNVMLSNSAHMIMNQKGNPSVYYVSPHGSGSEHEDPSFGGDDDIYNQSPHQDYEHHRHRDYSDLPRQEYDDGNDSVESGEYYRDYQRRPSTGRSVSSRGSHPSRRTHRSGGSNDFGHRGPPHHHHRMGPDDEESFTNASETFDEFTSLPRFSMHATGEEIEDAMERIKGDQYDSVDVDGVPDDSYHQGMDGHPGDTGPGRQSPPECYYYDRRHSDLSLEASSNHSSHHAPNTRGREPSSRSLRSVNTEEEIAAFERRKAHGILNRGGAVNLQHMTGGGAAAQQDRRPPYNTQNFSDHPPSSFHDYRAVAYRTTSSRSLDSVSSFGDDNLMLGSTVERQESMSSFPSQMRRLPSIEQHLGSLSSHSYHGGSSRLITQNSITGDSRQSLQCVSEHHGQESMNVSNHSVSGAGAPGRAVPVKAMDPYNNSTVSSLAASGHLGSRQNSQTSFNSTDEGMALLGLAGTDFVQIIQIMRDHPDSEPIQSHSMQEISNLHLSPEDCDTFAEVGGIEAIMDAMRHFSGEAELQLNACRALCNISSTRENQLALVDAGVAAWLLENTMETFAEMSDLLEQVMAALANLAALEDNLEPLIEKEIVSRVVHSMSKHGNDIGVQMKGCSVITNLASHPTPMKAAVMMAGGGGAVVMAMVLHAKDPQMQEKGLQALRNLSANCEENKVELAHIGGIDASITAMQVHRDDACVQEAGAWTLCNLAGNMNNKNQIGNSGGIDVIIRAMWVHSDQMTVHEWCVRSLFSLSLSPSNCRLILQVGGISAVVNAMQAHEKSSVVQEMGCAVLCNLASDEHSKLRIVDEEALDAIVLAMVLYGDDLKVQERACQVLLQLAIPQNVTSMHASNVVELVQVAAGRFPDHCGGHAEQLIGRLGQFTSGYNANMGGIPVMGGGN